jgi:hypothetical protein
MIRCPTLSHPGFGDSVRTRLRHLTCLGSIQRSPWPENHPVGVVAPGARLHPNHCSAMNGPQGMTLRPHSQIASARAVDAGPASEAE